MQNFCAANAADSAQKRYAFAKPVENVTEGWLDKMPNAHQLKQMPMISFGFGEPAVWQAIGHQKGVSRSTLT